jgi:hypothetical protein
MAGRVERDNQEPHTRQPAEQPHVGTAAEAETVQKDQRNPVTADRHTDPVAVVERHHMMGQPDAVSGGLACYRCLTHVNMVNRSAGPAPFRRMCAWLPTSRGVIYAVSALHSDRARALANWANVCATFRSPAAM